MKIFELSVYVLIGFGVMGDPCEESGCDIVSHMALRKVTKVAKDNRTSGFLISEFEPRLEPPQIEISGPKNSYLEGCLWIVDDQFFVSRRFIGGGFGDTGLLVEKNFPAYGRLLAIFLSEGESSCPPEGTPVFDVSLSQVGTILDSIGVAASPNDDGRLQQLREAMATKGFTVPATDFTWQKVKETWPSLIFRDASVNQPYAVLKDNFVNNGIVDADGNAVDDGAFGPAAPFGASDPFIASFGAINPSLSFRSFLISEFEPPLTQGMVEISGSPGNFKGCIWVVDEQLSVRSNQAQNPLDANGLLVVHVPDLAGPPSLAMVEDLPEPASSQFRTMFLSDGCPSGSSIQSVVVADVGNIYDSVAFSSSEDESDAVDGIQSSLQSKGFVVLGKRLRLPTGPNPALVFRDASVGDLYAVRSEPNPALLSQDASVADSAVRSSASVFDALGNEVAAGDFDADPTQPTFGFINPTFSEGSGDNGDSGDGEGSGVTGDPHIHTLDGRHYTLLREGSFLLWKFALEQPRVSWQMYAHYAGRQSFTKGFLLVDTSGPQPSLMEITSERCQWHTQSSKEWSAVSDALLSGPSSRMKLVGHQGKDAVRKIELFVAGEKAPAAKVKVVCRPGHHINMKLYMAKKWHPFVTGELKGDSKNQSSTSMLQLATKEDQEFEVKKTWEELGGSFDAQQYLQMIDDTPKHSASLLQACDNKAQADARAICQKHLGKSSASNSAYFEDCVFDVCSGAGEAAAEMAAEMLKF